MRYKTAVASVAAVLSVALSARAAETACPDGTNPDPAVIFCDDFESGTPVASRYFEYDDDEGDFIRMPGQGLNSSSAMRALWQPGEDGAGSLKRAFGRVPAGLGSPAQSHPDRDFREIYWRLYLKNGEGWSGSPDKVSRALIFASPTSWATALGAHVWTPTEQPVLMIDPASGIDENNRLITTGYNDFPNLRWLGAASGSTPVFTAENAGKWYCIESRVKLNSPGAADGIFQLWVNDALEAERTGLNWVGAWQDYGINAVFIENYWNNGAPAERVRYIDNIVFSRERIGCGASGGAPPEPSPAPSGRESFAPGPPRNVKVR